MGVSGSDVQRGFRGKDGLNKTVYMTESIMEKNDLKIDAESLSRVDKTIGMYERTSLIRFKKTLKELKLVRKYINERL